MMRTGIAPRHSSQKGRAYPALARVTRPIGLKARRLLERVEQIEATLRDMP